MRLPNMIMQVTFERGRVDGGFLTGSIMFRNLNLGIKFSRKKTLNVHNSNLEMVGYFLFWYFSLGAFPVLINVYSRLGAEEPILAVPKGP